MGHRHFFGTPHMLENDHEQNWDMHAEQPYGHIGKGNVGRNGSFCYPMENASAEGVQFTSHWNSAPRSNACIPVTHNDQFKLCQAYAPGPAQDPFLPRSNMLAFGSVPEKYFPHASSSNYGRVAPYAVEGSGFTDIAVDSGRAHQKRKSHGVSAVTERGSASRYHCGGTSSGIPPYSECRQNMTSMDAHHLPWDHLRASNPGYMSNSFSRRDNGSMRNVRNRSATDLDIHSHFHENPPLNSFPTSHLMEHSSLADIPGPSSIALTAEWSHANISPAHGRTLLPVSLGLSHVSYHSGASNTSNAPAGARGYDFMTIQNPVIPQIYHGSSSHPLEDPRDSYSHRSVLAYQPPYGTRLGNVNISNEGSQSLADNSSTYPMPLSASGWQNADRNRRSRSMNERFRSFQDEPGVHDRMSSGGFMVMDRSGLFSSRDMYDRHQDMRLDVDSMSYEELLALGERIGTVNTGLSEDSISKCLKESTHCSLIPMQDEGKCVICLELYKEADKVGMLKTCSHHYHVNCIKKWLSIKNSCPICKGSALADDMKGKSNQI